ncbi:hypothetical protein PoB_007239900 [Plakobranchus ocellatus]|uniref:Uncharacterized protein n=1 Tax=Plakobranchus ocellatus TaxID=259542 RepID=A0AAV4DNX1_9GAST|nr:hypothetical protein PoB_007239900 [Plakobranchus ocellatus]
MLRLQGQVDGLKKKLKKERKQRAVLEKSLGEVTTKLKDQQKTHELALHVVAKNMTRVHNFMKKNLKGQQRSAPVPAPRVAPPAPPRVVPAVSARESPAVPTSLAFNDLKRVASDVLAKVASVRAAPNVPNQNTAINLTKENLSTSGVFPDSASASQLTPKSLM